MSQPPPGPPGPPGPNPYQPPPYPPGAQPGPQATGSKPAKRGSILLGIAITILTFAVPWLVLNLGVGGSAWGDSLAVVLLGLPLALLLVGVILAFRESTARTGAGILIGFGASVLIAGGLCVMLLTGLN